VRLEELVVSPCRPRGRRGAARCRRDEGSGERVLDEALQGAAQGDARRRFRSDAVLSMIHCLAGVGDRERDALWTRLAFILLHQQLHDLHEVGVGERVKDDDLVEAIEELGVEGALDSPLTSSSILSRTMFSLLLWKPRALALLKVAWAPMLGGHDDDGVLEVERCCRGRR